MVAPNIDFRPSTEISPFGTGYIKMGHVAIFLTSMRVGGAQRIALNLCTGLAEKGHTIDLVLVKAEGALLNDLPSGISVIDLGASRVASSVLPLRLYLQKRNPNVLYAMMTEINVVSVVAHHLAGVDTRLVVSEHNTPSVSAEGAKDCFLLRLASHLYPRADHIVAVSRGVRDDLVDITDLNRAAITVVYNPIDVNTIRTRAEATINHEWFTDPSTNVIMSAGRHAPQKGFDTLLRAFDQLDDPSARLILLGDGEERESLRRLADKLGINDRVDFPGFVDNPFVYMSNADVFVLSSWYEGFGNVLIEAMATGCPVVATDCPSGPREILENGHYGPLVPVKDSVEMADAINEVLQDPIDSETLSQRADDFSIETITGEYESVFFGP